MLDLIFEGTVSWVSKAVMQLMGAVSGLFLGVLGTEDRYGAAISATQDLSDFFGSDNGKYGRAIINNSQNKIILNLEPDEAKYVQYILKMTKPELQAVMRFERGKALVCANNKKVLAVIKASETEKGMITTDRAELKNCCTIDKRWRRVQEKEMNYCFYSHQCGNIGRDHLLFDNDWAKVFLLDQGKKTIACNAEGNFLTVTLVDGKEFELIFANN